jgi:predicted glycoside hydrolase/deacetylase ChbG (UPF0249 family)
MKYLIVNGDDFGATGGINRGVVEAHRRGILTSASLLVGGPASEDAAALSRMAPRLSVGLHVELSTDDCRDELERQLARFEALMRQRPSHVDSHHNVHRDPRLLRCFQTFAQEHGLTLRESSPIRSITTFYGRWGGTSHAAHISAEGLVGLLEAEVREGITEVSCHPGYVDSTLTSSYREERELELRSLCDPIVRAATAAQSIQLINHREATALLAAASS